MRRLRGYFAAGMEGLIVSPLAVGDDPSAERDRVFRMAAVL